MLDSEERRLARAWVGRAAALLLLLVLVALPVLPVRQPQLLPAARLPALRLAEEGGGEEDARKKKKKDCDPPCVSPQVCVDGYCALPAAQPAATPAPPAAPHGYLLISQSPWLPDSLR